MREKTSTIKSNQSSVTNVVSKTLKSKTRSLQRKTSNEVVLGCHLKYLTSANCYISSKQIGASCFHEKEDNPKKVGKSAVTDLSNAKRDYTLSRGEHWTVPNKRTDHIRNNLLEFEENLKSCRVISINCIIHQIQIILSNGLFVTIAINGLQEIEKITLDRFLNKTISQEFGNISSAVIAKSFMVITSDDKNKLLFVVFNAVKNNFKLSITETKIRYLDVPGPPPNRKISRNICLNATEDLTVAWCSLYKSPTAWTPTSSDNERANLVLLACDNGRLDILSCTQTEYDPIFLQFSKVDTKQIFTLEKSSSNKNEVVVYFTVYEWCRNKIQRIQVNKIQATSGILSVAFNSMHFSSEDKLAIGCSNGSIILHDIVSSQTTVTIDSLVPSLLCWNINSGVLFVASGSGEMRCYDPALTHLPCSLVEQTDIVPDNPLMELSRYLMTGNGLINMKWITEKPGAINNNLLLLFDGGPLALLRFHLGVCNNVVLRPLDIIQEYVKTKQIINAIKVLGSLNWNTHATETFTALTSIFNNVIKQKLNHEREGYLEAVLGTFYVPKYTVSDSIVIEYRHAVSRYSRRFFFHLLRYRRFEKALLLATDLQSKDLFLDLYFSARKAGEIDIARSAKRKAYELQDSDSSSLEDSSDLSSDWEEEPISPHANSKKVDIMGSDKKIPTVYPVLKMNNFMKALMTEAKAVAAVNSESDHDDESSYSDEENTSTLKVLHLGYV